MNSQPQVWLTCALSYFELLPPRQLRNADFGLRIERQALNRFFNPHSAISNPKSNLVRRERLELSVRRLRGDCFTRLAYGARSLLHFTENLMKKTGGADEL